MGFTQKNIILSVDGNDVATIPNVIKSTDINSIQNVTVLIEHSKYKAEKLLVDAQQTAKTIKENTRKQTEEAVWARVINCINDFEAQRSYYFDKFEEQCKKVVTTTINCLLNDVPDEEKIKTTLLSVINQAREEKLATLWVNPKYYIFAGSIIKSSTWKLKEDSQLAEDACVLDVDTGKFKSSFQGRVDRLISVIKETYI
ncbi:hypothetical protein H0A36_09100 [Endozoicomonas sp. SM1973]|uniref:Flagellar assembly protein FliH/Type III secretion system HrpE domain-containing protein n=1 Tax=Spartinivicinus marinus TaxID=2994442 RepID=A0A853I0N5_9GAMM|nr:hypothetical protein [Spartinivicinus marinus]NYZ66169.1 hypothetical protein [Spartinivicinus marinus]